MMLLVGMGLFFKMMLVLILTLDYGLLMSEVFGERVDSTFPFTL